MSRRKLVVTVSVALALLAAVLVTFGVGTHKEPGFTDASRRWGRMPLLVSCRGYVEDADSACAQARHAVTLVNRRLGFPALQWSDVRGPTHQIDVVMRAPVEPSDATQEAGGSYVLRVEGSRYAHCAISTRNVATEGLEILVAYHELGHCLGLAHDNYPGSIMHPTQEEPPERSFAPWISDHDRRLLRERYAP